MLSPAFYVLAATVALGLILVLLHGIHRLRMALVLGPLHGLLGATGLTLLMITVERGKHQAAVGAAQFGAMACVLLGIGLLLGLLVWRVRVRRGDPLLAIGLHATLAIFGFVLLAAYAVTPS